jgi:hypothetical protein
LRALIEKAASGDMAAITAFDSAAHEREHAPTLLTVTCPS